MALGDILRLFGFMFYALCTCLFGSILAMRSMARAMSYLSMGRQGRRETTESSLLQKNQTSFLRMIVCSKKTTFINPSICDQFLNKKYERWAFQHRPVAQISEFLKVWLQS